MYKTLEKGSTREQTPYSSGRLDCLDALKLIACIMITNSHCRSIYPLYFFAIGGGHGNGLFFAISGFLLANIHDSFDIWIKRRLNRIVPVTIVFVFISLTIELVGRNALYIDLFEACHLVLNRYWFVAAIILYYPVYYFVFDSKNDNWPWISICIYVVLYILIYTFSLDKNAFGIETEGFVPIKVFFYFGVFVSGGLIRRTLDKREIFAMHIQEIKPRVIMLLIAGLAFLVWVLIYALIMIKETGYQYQFLIHVGVWVFSVAILLFTVSFREYRLPNSIFGSFIRIASASTLEIYLLQVTIQERISMLLFPISWLLFFGIAFSGGMFIHALMNKMR